MGVQFAYVKKGCNSRHYKFIHLLGRDKQRKVLNNPKKIISICLSTHGGINYFLLWPTRKPMKMSSKNGAGKGIYFQMKSRRRQFLIEITSHIIQIPHLCNPLHYLHYLHHLRHGLRMFINKDYQPCHTNPTSVQPPEFSASSMSWSKNVYCLIEGFCIWRRSSDQYFTGYRAEST